ncbi:MAG: ATP synthase F1 subunit delta [Saprospiraceae bacterium]|nr:ATP synthase F1 subunit delta [Saprospiraceae bacterium]
MSVARIAHRYAKSLADLAIEQKKLDRVLEDVQSFKQATQNRDFHLFIKSPVIHHGKKQQVIEKLFASQYDELTMAFLRILIKKGREAYLPEIANEFIQEYKKYKHITSVRLITAATLGEAAVKAIHDRLETSIETDDNVQIEVVVDEKLIGGFILEFDGKIYDASVKSKLEELKKEFEDNLYISQIIAR